MLKDIDAIKIPIEIQGKKLYLLHNLNSLLYLEHMTDYEILKDKSPDKWTTNELLHYLRSLLMDYFYEKNRELIEKRDFEHVKPTLTELGEMFDESSSEEILILMLTAIAEAYPNAPMREDNGNFLTGGRR